MDIRKKSPGLAVLLSLIPGLGHVYAGEAGKGLLLFVGTGLAGFLMVLVPGLGAVSSLAGSWSSGVFDPMSAGMAVVVTAPLFVLVIGPALVIYSMASSHRTVIKQNAAIDAGMGLGSVAGAAGVALSGPEAGAAADGGLPGALPAAAISPDIGTGDWTVVPGQATFWGAVLAALGVLLILPPLFPGLVTSIGQLWPLALVVLGAAVIWGATANGRMGRGS